MTKSQQFTNPFYGILLVAGLAFMVTACAYAVMTVRDMRPAEVEVDTVSSRQFAEFMDEHGFTALMIELGVLAAATFAAMATDDYWSKRAARDDEQTESNAATSD